MKPGIYDLVVHLGVEETRIIISIWVTYGTYYYPL
jgi:hypothetical protein